jgi:hypothetical protein
MARWRVTGAVTGSQYMGEFEAETADAAIDKANIAKGGSFGVCHQCSDVIEDAEVTACDADLILESEEA